MQNLGISRRVEGSVAITFNTPPATRSRTLLCSIITGSGQLRPLASRIASACKGITGSKNRRLLSPKAPLRSPTSSVQVNLRAGDHGDNNDGVSSRVYPTGAG